MKQRRKPTRDPRRGLLRKAIAAQLGLSIPAKGRLVVTVWVSQGEPSEGDREALHTHVREIFGATEVRSDIF